VGPWDVVHGRVQKIGGAGGAGGGGQLHRQRHLNFRLILIHNVLFMFRKDHKCLVQVDLAKMKNKDTLKEVEKALGYQSDDMVQRAGELQKVSEERFPKVTQYQGRRKYPFRNLDRRHHVLAVKVACLQLSI
jgi:hypothetical protein